GDVIFNSSQSMFFRYNKIDNKKQLSNDLDIEWICNKIKGSKCVYCGDDNEVIGLDRINNNIGHTKSNCVTCCRTCNVTRMDNFSHEEMFIIGKCIRGIKNNRHFEMKP